jgi:transposase
MMRLTEEQYEMIRPLLPVQRGNVQIANLDVLNAVLFVAENGCKWRALPARFGKTWRAWGSFCRLPL